MVFPMCWPDSVDQEAIRVSHSIHKAGAIAAESAATHRTPPRHPVRVGITPELPMDHIDHYDEACTDSADDPGRYEQNAAKVAGKPLPNIDFARPTSGAAGCAHGCYLSMSSAFQTCRAIRVSDA